ncbi:MAG: phosphate transport system permease protein, partial [Moritella sp.]
MKKSTSFLDRLFVIFCTLSTVVLIFSVSTIIIYLVIHGWRSIGTELVFGDTNPLDAILFKKRVFDGIFPAIIGTLALIFLSLIIALPLGLSTGIYLSEYAGKRLKYNVGLMVDILAGIPSIVIGLFGFSITVFLHGMFPDRIYPCLAISAVALSFLVLPYIIKSTQVSLQSIPSQVRLTGISLGADKFQNLIHVLLPAATADIVSGMVLAMGRCAEDTAVIMLTGVVATAGVPKSLFSSFEALPFYIYYTASEYSDLAELERAHGAALVLLFICFVL